MTAAALAGLSALDVVARADWPEPGDPAAPPVVPGFVVSTFAPLVAVTGERCLSRATAPARTAIVVVTACGDVASAAHVAAAVDTGTRIGPLMFFQSVPNAVAGHLAARHGLGGPVVCLSPGGDPLADGLAEAGLLIDDGDADAALVIVAGQDPDVAYAVLAVPAGVHR